jgi:type IV secretory pathway VirB2 component (pilin)
MTLSPRARRNLAFGLALALIASPALAQTTTAAGGNLGSFIQNIINMMNSGIVRGLAILAVIVTGVAWMFGHLDFRRAATVVLGIIIIFGATTIVDVITGGASA